jgi:hypothetical protein
MATMFAIAVGLIIWRRPDAVTYPQFWAEDGKFWFAGAYNSGLSALLVSEQGYLQTLPRLVAVPGAGLSIQHAALLFNLVGISTQAAPAAFFMSRRFEHVVPRLELRGLIGLVYVLIPSYELNATITNAQWHLAILAILVLIAAPATRRGWHLFDISVLTLSGLTGPFAALLLPVVLLRMWLVPAARRWYGWLSTVLSITLLVQGWAVLHGHRDTIAPLGPTLRNITFIITDRVVLAGLFAEEGHSHVFTQGSVRLLVAVLIAVVAAAVVGFLLLRASSPVRLFVGFCFAVTAVSLLSPLATGGTSAWDVLANGGSGERYFLTAELAWMVCVIWAVSRLRHVALRALIAAPLAVAFISGLLASWSYPLYVDDHPAAYTQELRNASVGTHVVVPLNPGWTMELIRR